MRSTESRRHQTAPRRQSDTHQSRQFGFSLLYFAPTTKQKPVVRGDQQDAFVGLTVESAASGVDEKKGPSSGDGVQSQHHNFFFILQMCL